MVLQRIARVFGGDVNKRELERLYRIADEINAYEQPFEELSDGELKEKTVEFKQRLADGETLDDLLPEAFAAVREASKRTIGLRHYDVQMVGGIVLHQGKIAEMRTGEGKTLVATLPLYLNALTGRGVHLVTVNDYLARRDARWMAPVYHALGLTVGVLQMATRTENGRMAFLVNLENENAREDMHQLDLVLRSEAYAADITYGTNSEFGFDYLRDNLTMSLAERVQRGHYYAIVDEVDNILIDEARTPLIISGPASENVEEYTQMAQVIRQLNAEDYEINEKDRQVSLTEIGEAHIEEILNTPLRNPSDPEAITPDQARILGFIEQALRAQHLYRRNKDYIVQGGKVVIVDEFTGRLMPGRRWSEGLHQAIEAKEGVKIEPENVTYATITIQNYFRMYEKLAGMTGTALTEAEEFEKIYKLAVQPIPMNLEYSSQKADSELKLVSTRDKDNYPVEYYALKSDPDEKPVYWRRQDYPDLVYRSEEGKLRAITTEIIHTYALGRPQLVGTTSVEHSERLSQRLSAEPLRRLGQAMLIRQAWIEKHNKSPELEIAELQFLNKPLDDLNTSDLRQAARQAGLSSINLEDGENTSRVLSIFDVTPANKDRLMSIFQGGIPHQVLNARKHDEESQIIARAGSFGAVTIATNMAGRGVDIKLGGELSEEVLADVIHVLERAGVPDPFDMNNDQRREELLKLNQEDYGIYEESVKTFLDYLDNMKKVRALGGLHVVGSERHEARRIDNQLRGRAARQGDPGSSRFYLSLEDELMRLFGGPSMEALMGRLKVDASLPIESNLLGRMVEQAQERVEGNNFDVRKHLLEYDDVLNGQRKRIYSERDRAFEKEDLSEDIDEILRTELQERVNQSAKDEEGTWKLLAFLDEVQPTSIFEQEGVRTPSFTVQQVMDEVRRRYGDKPFNRYDLTQLLLTIAGEALKLENEHISSSTHTLISKTIDSVNEILSERMDTLDRYLESAGEPDEETQQLKRPQQLLEQISNETRTALRLNSDEMKRLPDGDTDVRETLSRQISSTLNLLAVSRLIGSIERRLDENLNLRPQQLIDLEWDEIGDGIMQAISSVLQKREENLTSPQGPIAQNIETYLNRNPFESLEDDRLSDLLLEMSYGTRIAIDARTHQRGFRRILLVNYIYFAASLIQDLSSQALTAEILEHLQGTLQKLETVWGKVEFERFRIANVPVSQIEALTLDRFTAELTEEETAALLVKTGDQLSADERQKLSEIMGRRTQNEINRHTLVSVISDLWVDHLTKMESLRVSIGLEAFAQRDPLVQYKGKGSEMFKELLSEIRIGVISRIFRYQPRRPGAQAQDQRTAPAEAPRQTAALTASNPQKKKRKRH